MIHIIVVDDHRLFRMAIRAALVHNHPDIQLIGEAENGPALFALPALTTANIVLLDINLPGMDGITVARLLRSRYPQIKILAISAENTSQTVKSMIEVGIDGFVSKQQGDLDELVQAIRSVANGIEYFGRDISAIIFEVFVAKKKNSAVPSEFTTREKEIIDLCRQGMLCKEIAGRLGIGVSTVNTHKKNIFLKLGINNTMEMVQYALKEGIIRIEH
ncbi:MAG: response regulator transcription factor [Prevotellaceae bacterium]|jgi:DNA-binding NarL/FixJ family response regulator|nr:response regulator transcription factor [Prevotellaceae bacterium]